MRRVGIIQARLGSSRLPGKVLMDLEGRPMLHQQLYRLKRCKRLDELVVATTTHERDDQVVKAAETFGVRWFRGSEKDVLSRYAGAAAEAKADLVVRLTADCPLADPEIVDRVVAAVEDEAGVDYASNVVQRTYPKGLDAEALTMDTLRKVDKLATTPAAREHVTWFILEEQPALFKTRAVVDVEDNSSLRWTVDTAKDLANVRYIYQALELDQRVLPYREMVDSVLDLAISW